MRIAFDVSHTDVSGLAIEIRENFVIAIVVLDHQHVSLPKVCACATLAGWSILHLLTNGVVAENSICRKVFSFGILKACLLLRSSPMHPCSSLVIRYTPAPGSRRNKARAIVAVAHAVGGAGIVYCLSRKDAEQVCEALQASLRCAFYHGDLDAASRDAVAEAWAAGAVQVFDFHRLSFLHECTKSGRLKCTSEQ